MPICLKVGASVIGDRDGDNGKVGCSVGLIMDVGTAVSTVGWRVTVGSGDCVGAGDRLGCGDWVGESLGGSDAVGDIVWGGGVGCTGLPFDGGRGEPIVGRGAGKGAK